MSLDISRIQALCFDMDGTLCDTDDQMVSHLEKWIRWFTFLFPGGNSRAVARWLVMAMENPGTYMHGLSDQLYLDHHIANLSDGLYKLKPSRGINSLPPLIPGVKEMLLCLRNHFPMALVSVRGRRSTVSFLEYHELNLFFHTVVTGQTCLHTKPYPDPILWAASQIGIPPSLCLMIGDTTVDILAGKAAGAQTIGVLCGFGEREELSLAGADLILQTTADLHEVFQVCECF